VIHIQFTGPSFTVEFAGTEMISLFILHCSSLLSTVVEVYWLMCHVLIFVDK